MVAALLLLLSSNAEELYRRGVQAFEKGRLGEAVQALTQAASAAPGNPQIWKALGVVYASTEDYQRAAKPFSTACALAPKLPDVCFFYGRNLYALNQFETSLRALRSVLPTDKSPSRVHLAIAQALEALGRAPEAEEEFQSAIQKREPSRADFDPRLHYAIFLFRQGRTEEAIAPAAQTVADHPDSGRALYELGRIEYHLARLQPAITHLERAAGLGYGDAQPMLAKARARLKALGE